MNDATLQEVLCIDTEADSSMAKLMLLDVVRGRQLLTLQTLQCQH